MLLVELLLGVANLFPWLIIDGATLPPITPIVYRNADDTPICLPWHPRNKPFPKLESC